MSISSMPSPVFSELLDTGEYCLVPFPYAEPYLTIESEERPDEGRGRESVVRGVGGDSGGDVCGEYADSGERPARRSGCGRCWWRGPICRRGRADT